MSDLTLLETDRLVLSGWTMDQVDDLVRLHGNPNISRNLTLSGEPWTEEQARKAVAHWIELFATRRLGKMRLTRKSDGNLVGRAGYGIYPPTHEPELGFALFEEYQGQGYATEAATALRDWIFPGNRRSPVPRFCRYPQCPLARRPPQGRHGPDAGRRRAERSPLPIPHLRASQSP